MRSKFKDEHPFGEQRQRGVLAGGILPLSVLIVLTSLLCLEKRKAEAERIRQKYPDRIPVRCNTASLGVWCPDVTQRMRIGHLREGGQDGHPHDRQEEIFGAFCTRTLRPCHAQRLADISSPLPRPSFVPLPTTVLFLKKSSYTRRI